MRAIRFISFSGLLFAACLVRAQSPAIVAGECFINVDQGVGTGTSFGVTSGATVQSVFSGIASALQPGLHSLNIRFKDADGHWGIAKGYHFLVIDPSAGEPFTPAANIIAGEYFRNTDPGAGNGTSFSVTSGATTQAIFVGEASMLLPGLHSLNIRFKDADGHWGIAKSHHFLVIDPSAGEPFTPAANIVAGEYFLNSDPGAGSATAFSVSPGATVQAVFLGNASALPIGAHTLMVRFKDADGHWGVARPQPFTVEELVSTGAALVGISPFTTDTILPEGTYPLQITVGNSGANAITGLSIEAELDGAVQSSTWTGTIAPGDTVSITTDIGLSVNSGTVHDLIVRIDQDDTPDNDPANDTLAIDPFFADPVEPHFGMDLGANGSYLTVADHPSLDLITDFTLECWVRPGTSDDATLFHKKRCGVANGLSLVIEGGELHYAWIAAGGNCTNAYSVVRTTGPVLDLNKWSHVALVHRSDTVIIMINGVPVNTFKELGSYGPNAANNEALLIGAYKSAGGVISTFLGGRMDECRVWNEPRTAEEIRTWMVKTDGLALSGALVSVWHFGEGGGPVAQDDHGSNDATLVNGAVYTLAAAPIEDPPSTDLELQTIDLPTSVCLPTAPLTIPVMVRNNGTQPVETFQLSVEIDGEVHTAALDTTLAPGANFEYTFAQSITWNSPGVTAVRSWVQLVGDEFLGNDTLETTVTANQGVIIALEDDLAVCAGDSVTLHAAGGSTYSWSTGATTPNITVVPPSTITYTVTVTNAGGCSALDSAKVTVNPLPTAPVVAPTTAAICPGASVTFTSNLPGVTWSQGTTGAQVVVSLTGSYFAINTDLGTGCSAHSNTAVVSAAASLSILALGPLALCQGDVLDLVAQPAGSTVSWTGGSTADTLHYQGTSIGVDTIVLSGQTAAGCDQPASVVVNVIPSGPPAPVVEMLPVDGSLFVPQSVTLSYQPLGTAGAYDVYLWVASTPEPSVPFVDNTTATNIPVSGLLPNTTYNWFVRAFNSCDSSQSSTRSFSTTGTIDLVIDTLIIPSTIVAGTDVQVSFVCRNIGTGPTGTQTWPIRFWLSTDNDLRIADDQLLLTIPNLTWLGAGQSYAQTVTVPVPQDFSGTWFFYVIADNDDAYCWNANQCLNGPYGHHNSEINESNENNNFRRTVVQIAIPPAPDLVPYLVGSAAGPFNSNASLPVAVGFRNDGELSLHDQDVTGIVHVTAAEQYDDPSWALPPNVNSSGGNLSYPDGAARYFVIHIDSLAPGQDTIVQTTVQLQPSMNGTYHVFATVDADNQIFEADGEENNWLERTGTIELTTAAADIVPLTLALPATKASGTTLTIPYQWKNLLPLTPVVINYLNKAYLSASPVLNPATAKLLGTRFRSDGTSLTQDLVKSDQFSALIPIDTLGDYFIHVWVDANDDIYEPDANMHANVVTHAIHFYLADTINLTVASVNAPATAVSGQTVNVQVSYGNTGPDGLNQATALALYRSSYAQYHPDSVTLVGTVSMPPAALGPGSNLNTTFPVLIPNGYAGSLYFHAFADHTNAVFELNEANIATAATTVSIAPYPDLIVGSIVAPSFVTPRTNLTIGYTVTNTGDAPVNAFDRTDRYVLSTDTVLGNTNDIVLGTRTFSNTAIGIGGSLAVSATLDLAFDFPYGPRYLFIVVDENNGLFEYNNGLPAEYNNVSAPALVTVAPAYTDVAVMNLALESANVLSGQSTTAQFQVRNLGPNTADNNIRVDRLYLSADMILGGDYAFNTTTVPNVLDSGEVVQRSFSYQIPNGISGDWHVIAVTDVGNNCTNDSVPGNHLATAPIHIELSDPVDLHITAIDPLPGTMYSGQCLTLGYSVSNDSIGAHAGTWHDRVLINNAPSTVGALPLTAVSHSGISGTSGYSGTISFCLPGYMSGSRYLILRTDAYNTVYEHQAENNNDTIIPVFLNVPAPTDLEVTMVEGPEMWFLGFDSTVVLNVRNNGPGVAVGLLGNNVHFSTNQLLEPLIDPLLGSANLGILLQPGEDIDISLVHLLSGIDIGSYYLAAATNTQASIFETDLSNNTGFADTPTEVDATEFQLNDTAYTTLNSGELRYYKVEVTDPGLDVLVSLLTDQPFNDNRLYVSLGNVPTEVDHDFTQIEGTDGTKQVLIPSAAVGTYFILATTQVQTPDDQAIGVTAVGLPFSIVAVNPNPVGQGPVTTTVIGAGFTPELVFELKDDGGNVVTTGSVSRFVNSMSVEVGWDMTEVDTGFYSVEAINNAMDQAVYEPLQVAEGDDYVLLVADESAEVLKSSGIAYLTYRVTNDGLVDIPIVAIGLELDSGIVVHEVVTSTNVIQFIEMFDFEGDSLNYSILTRDGYTTISLLSSALHPQEELIVSVAVSGQRPPVINPLITAQPKSYEQFVMEGLFELSTTRAVLLADFADGVDVPEDLLALFSDPDALVTGQTELLLASGIIDESWYSSYTNACPTCLSMPITPGLPIGTEHFANLTIGNNRIYIWQINDLNGGCGIDPGWDVIAVDGTLTFEADSANPLILNIGPINEQGMFYPLDGFDACTPYSWTIIKAGLIQEFDTSKVFINDDYFRVLSNTPEGAFRVSAQGDSAIVLHYIPACVSCDTDEDTDGDGTLDCHDLCPNDPNKIVAGACGCGMPDTDTDGDGFSDCEEGCDLDHNKQFPGFCGCGVPDIDTDNDGWLNCFDLCPSDPGKRFPGSCGCGIPDTDNDDDGLPNCIDPCPEDPNEVLPGICECGSAQDDPDNDGVINCFDQCPFDPLKIMRGTCGCGMSDTDSDDDGTANCIDLCPFDPNKITPGWCGCGTPETDDDNDGFPNCIDPCQDDPYKVIPGLCGCGVTDSDSDGDLLPDCIDECPYDPWKIEPGACGCGNSDWDSDRDGCLDCEDACPTNPEKCDDAGVCGCGMFDGDADGDGWANCVDGCPNDPNKHEPGNCGCGFDERNPCVECKTLESNTCSSLLDMAYCASKSYSCVRSIQTFVTTARAALAYSAGAGAVTIEVGGLGAVPVAAVAAVPVAWFGGKAIYSCYKASKTCSGEGLNCDQLNVLSSSVQTGNEFLQGVTSDNANKFVESVIKNQYDPKLFQVTMRQGIGKNLKELGGLALQYGLCYLKSVVCKKVASPCDPNEIIGPVGSGNPGWIAENITASYTVNFENDSLAASSNAQVVRVTVALDTEMNAYALRVGSVTVGDTTIQVPPGLMYYSTQFMHNGVLVQLNAGVDIPNREAYWVFESLDPLTLMPPYSPLIGFLPVNDNLGSGTGSVSFSILPSSVAETRDTISAQAEIVFDINEPILTNIWTNLLDAEGPQSQVDSLVSVNDSTVVVHYTAIDPNQGSGVERVDMYAAPEGAPLELVVANLHPDSSYRFTGALGEEYCFATVAHDSVYHTEVLPLVPDQCVLLTPGTCTGQYPLRVAAKILLMGPYDPGTDLMHDSLRVKGLIPLTEPYTGLGYAHAGAGGGESIAPSLLAASGNNAIIDWVVVELRDKVTPANVLLTRAALLQRDGDVVDIDGTSPVTLYCVPDNYYVAIRHRNHLGAMTLASLALNATPTAVDLTSAAVATWGTDARSTVAGRMVLWSGEVQLDGEVKYTGQNNDRDPILVAVGSTIPTNTVVGYLSTDVNMNGRIKYTGAVNDRDPILVNVGSTTPNNVRMEQLP